MQLREKLSPIYNKLHLKKDILKSQHHSQENTPTRLIGESKYCEKFNQMSPGDKKSHEKSIFSIINDQNCPPSIWCMDFADDLIVLGCSDGRLEFWEASTAKFHVSLTLLLIINFVLVFYLFLMSIFSVCF